MIDSGEIIESADFVVTAVAGENLTANDAVYISTSDGKAYKCDADDATKTRFAGFVQETVLMNANATIRCHGIMRGFVGLTAGAKYYLSGTAGAISSSAGTYEVGVGIALTTTVIRIQHFRRHAIGAAQFSDAGSATQGQTSAITLGFRPRLIRMVGATGNGSGGSTGGPHSAGFWNGGSYAGIYDTTDSADNFTNAILRIYTSAGTDHWTVTITSVTDTGFTISVVQNDNSPVQLNLAWEAEGDI